MTRRSAIRCATWAISTAPTKLRVNVQGAQQHLVASPNAAVWLIYLAFALERVGDEFLQRGALPDALKNYQQDLSVAVALYCAEPAQRQLSVRGRAGLTSDWETIGWRRAISQTQSRNTRPTWMRSRRSRTKICRIFASSKSPMLRTRDSRRLSSAEELFGGGRRIQFLSDGRGSLPQQHDRHTASNNNAALYDQATPIRRLATLRLRAAT